LSTCILSWFFNWFRCFI